MPVILGGNTGIYLASLTPSVDPDAQAFITAAAITNPTQQAAINTLVVDLKGYNVWTKMKALYPFVSDNRNLLSYTENFENAYWLKYNTSISANAINAPNGTLTADELNEGGTSNYHGFKTTINGLTPNSTWGASISLKYNNRRYVSIGWYINASPYPSFGAIIDTQNKTIVSSSNTLTASIELQSNDWFRVKLTGNIGNYTNAYTFQVSLLDDSLNEIYLGTNKSVYVWGSQIEIGTSVTAYQPITFTPQSFMATQHKFNLKNPLDTDAAFRLVFSGGWTHSSTGATPNGTNGYADTFIIPNTNLSLDSTHLSYYSRTNITGPQVDMGVTETSAACYLLYNYNNLAFKAINRLEAAGGSTYTPTTGFLIGSRNSSTTEKYYHKGTLINTLTITSALRSTFKMFLGAYNNANVASGYSSKQTAFASIGDGLLDSEANNLYLCVQQFNTTLGRQV
jgi:hypothetical protein